RYRNWGLSTAEIKAYRGIYPEVGGGDAQEVGGDPAAAESAGIPEALAGAETSEAVPHAPVGGARRRRSRDSLLPELQQLALQHRIVNVGALVEVQRRRVGDLVLHPLVQEGPGAPRSRQPRHLDDLLHRVLPLAHPVLLGVSGNPTSQTNRFSGAGQHAVSSGDE